MRRAAKPWHTEGPNQRNIVWQQSENYLGAEMRHINIRKWKQLLLSLLVLRKSWSLKTKLGPFQLMQKFLGWVWFAINVLFPLLSLLLPSPFSTHLSPPLVLFFLLNFFSLFNQYLAKMFLPAGQGPYLPPQLAGLWVRFPSHLNTGVFRDQDRGKIFKVSEGRSFLALVPA